MEKLKNVKKHRDIRFVGTDRKRIYLVPEPNYHRTKLVLRKTTMNKTKVKINKMMYLSLLILDMSKIVMYEYCCYYSKQRYGEKAKLCLMDTGNLIVCVKSENVYADLAENVVKIFDT